MPGPPAPSALSALLNGGSGSGSAAALANDEDEDAREFVVYLPSREAIEMRLRHERPVEDVLYRAVCQWQTSGSAGGPGCGYELRLHDEDGLPDEDCPALDPKSPLSLLGGMDEFCLVEKGGTAERSAAGADDDRDEAGIGNENVEIEAPPVHL